MWLSSLRHDTTSASPRHCTLKRGSTMFFVRRNKATSGSIVLNTLPLAYDKRPLTSKQDADISPTISIQCFTSALYSETRFDHVLCSPKQGHVSLHCTQHASPCLYRNTIDLEIRQAEDKPGEEGIREMSREPERTSDSRLKVIESH